jgi:Fic family protein
MVSREIITFKSGKFVFSHDYRHLKLIPLITESEIIYQTIKDIPILPSIATQIEEEIVCRSIFSTAAIEGNPLNEERVAEIISATDTFSVTGEERRKETREIEIHNIFEVYEVIKNMPSVQSGWKIDEGFIRHIHKKMTQNIKYQYNIPGNYRNHIVKVGDNQHGGIYTPPKCLADIKTLMTAYVDWINSDEVIQLPSSVRAALSHYYFGIIHPFGDGNGRTARIIEGAILKSSGIRYLPVMLSNYYYRHIDDYYLAFSFTRKNKSDGMTPFIEFVLRGCIESLYKIKQKIIDFILILTLRDYYNYLKNEKKINQRQYELLTTIMNGEKKISFIINDLFLVSPFRILYANTSERTARRDLNKLRKMQLLSMDAATYRLNWKVLDDG